LKLCAILHAIRLWQESRNITGGGGSSLTGDNHRSKETQSKRGCSLRLRPFDFMSKQKSRRVGGT